MYCDSYTQTRAGWKIEAAKISDALIRSHADRLAEPITRIFNLSLSTSRFPKALRDSRVIPLYKKKGDRNLASNYRPITLVDYSSKVFERLVRRVVFENLEGIGSFSNSQFGFRPKRSTELAMAKLS